jgi:hypothetical protein
VVRTVKIDPDDPFVSAAALRSVDLSPFLSVGKHEVRVSYDGSLTVPATATIRRWNSATKIEGLGLKIDRALSSESVSVGASAQVILQLTSTGAHAQMIVKVPLPIGLSADTRALEGLVRAGTIAGFRAEGALVLSLSKVTPGTRKLEVPVFGTRRGSFDLAPVTAWVPRSSAEGWSGDAKVVVK